MARIIIGCEESQTICKAYREKGHEAYSCDLLPCSGGHPEWHIQDNVLNHLNDTWDIGIFHPVCRRLTNAGVRWLHIPPKNRTLQSMWDEFYQAIMFYKKLQNAPIKKKAIENPVFHVYARLLLGESKRQIVQPWWFGDKAFKATGFELYNLPELKPTNKLIPPKKGTQEHKEWSFIHRMPPSPDRETLRSKTFKGIANAIANQWN